MPTLSPFVLQPKRWRHARSSSFVAGLACLFFLGTLGQEVSAQDAIRRIERDYNLCQENRRLRVLTLRSRESVALASNLIRLGDVVEPVDPDMPGWSDLARMGIGLVPVDGTEMVIQRERLEPFIHSGYKRPLSIRWIGPMETNVRCQTQQETLQATAISGGDHDSVRARSVSASEILRASATSPLDGIRDDASTMATQRSIANVDGQYLMRVKRWIAAAFATSGDTRLDRYDFRVVEVEKIRPTKRSLDIAILGAGFLQVMDPAGKSRAFVPAGALDIDINGDLVLVSEPTSMLLYPTVSIPKNAQGIRIKSDGTVEVQVGDMVTWKAVGKIVVSTDLPDRAPVNKATVMLASATRSVSQARSASAFGSCQVLQGFLELPGQDAYREFESIVGVEAVTCLHRLREGSCKFRLQGRGVDGPVDLIIGLHLTAKPVVVHPAEQVPATLPVR